MDTPESNHVNTEMDPEQLAAKVRNSAVGSLARREHSYYELREKLLHKFNDAKCVDAALEWVSELGYLDDARFAGMFVRSSVSKGRGPERITRELQQKGVAAHIVEDALAECDVNWLTLAEEVLRRKFPVPAQEYKDKAKQMRYLQYRGFTMSQIYELV